MLKDLINVCGEDNPAGVRVVTYVVSPADILTWPAFSSGANPGDSVTLDGNIVLKPLKSWKRIDITSNTGEIKDTLVGPVGSKSWDTTFDHYIPKANSKEIEHHKNISNGCFVMLVKDKAGKFRILGNPEDPAYIEANEISTGKASGDSRGATVQVKASVGSPAPFYTGTIDLDAAS